MKLKCLLEISVESVKAAMAAERGGADRVELCGHLSVGGITPGVRFLRTARNQVHIPVFAMIRPRRGDFVYSDSEFATMKDDIDTAKRLGLNGVVLGILKQDRQVDVQRTRELVELARPLPVTFHRAFDESADLRQALEDVMRSGAKRILTSGGARSAPEGSAVLAELIEAAGERIVIIPGAGISAANIAEVARRTKAREFHSGLSKVLPYGSKDHNKFEEEVRRLAEQVARISPARSTSG
jgi:copper homeostasis protein